ncbi:Hypothetical protein PHPALM_20318 [Phytophthora palmivora]|uniref:Reverse transcriptase Ty1/copia-type domain-containing protein n=1 Tax=Phytophthora palmivora TaxID=4796 RepID=A0A2P4XF54_9STRA|nr:Hypothetical protein PHPALM_20318 [Phytophthora palmivora]
MELPEGLRKLLSSVETEREDDVVCLLLLSLYGLKQASRVWNENIDAHLKSMEFKAADEDPCIYTRGRGDGERTGCLYVDDMLIASPHSPRLSYSGTSHRKGYRSLFDSESDEAETEGTITETQAISNDLDQQQERYQPAQLQGAPEVSTSAPPTPVYLRGYIHRMRGLGLPCSWSTSRPLVYLTMGAIYMAPMSVPWFKTNHSMSMASRPLGVLLAPHRIPLKELTSFREKPEDRGGLFPVWGSRALRPNLSQNTWVSLKNFAVQELKELREDRLLSYVLDLRDLRIEFALFLAKRQLHSVMEGLRQQSKSSAQDERGYGSVNPGTVHLIPEPVFRLPCVLRRGGIPTTAQAAGASQSATALGEFAPHGRGVQRSDQGEQDEPSHVSQNEVPSQPLPSGPLTSGRDSVGTLFSDEVRRLRDRVYAIEVALGLGPGGQSAIQAVKPGAFEVLRQDMDAFCRQTRETHVRVGRRVHASALKELRRGLGFLSHVLHGQMPFMRRKRYPYQWAYGYGCYGSSSHSVPSYPSYDSRGYQSVYHSQASTPAAPVVQGAPTRFEEVSVNLAFLRPRRMTSGSFYA